MSHIFISYATPDRALANQLRRVLAKSNKKQWLDWKFIFPGADFNTAIEKALRSARTVVVLLTPRSAQSPYVTFEWSFALGASIPVLPVMVEKTPLHLRLQSTHVLDLTAQPCQWEKLIHALKEQKRPTTVLRPASHKVRPRIFATFDLTGGKPTRIERSYKIWVSTKRVPLGTSKVSYNVEDEGFVPARWTVRNDRVDFRDYITSYGDIYLNACGTGRGGKWQAHATLVEALYNGYGSRRLSPAIRRALRDIDAH